MQTYRYRSLITMLYRLFISKNALMSLYISQASGVIKVSAYFSLSGLV